ncbi:sarcosine oxidase subunit gamma [Nesterenkonia sp. F]|uniref:sarcosine oxidase subunit gamma n=1 Tax=Nesterenkonia sp. F TaxID=795955 RepID=UPI000255CCEA|nr:sarcosine oxidase subunit gamma family protein [Nesterenkonia sp. F]
MADILFTQGPDELKRAPLAPLHRRLEEVSQPAPSTIRLAERPFTTQIGLRAVPDTAAHRSLAETLGVGLPDRVGEVTGDAADVAVLWLGPDEFLVVAPPNRSELVPLLQEALGAEPGQVVDLSANRTIIELGGSSARDVLDKGVPADLHPRVFPTGTAVTTTLGPAAVLLWRAAEENWWILPRVSFAEYTAQWLLDAVREHRLAAPDGVSDAVPDAVADPAPASAPDSREEAPWPATTA